MGGGLLVGLHGRGQAQPYGRRAFLGRCFDVAQAQVRVKRHGNDRHGLARQGHVALFRAQPGGDGDLDVALLRRLADGVGHETDLLRGIGRGRRYRHGPLRRIGVEQGDVFGQGLGVHLAVEGGLAAHHHHGPAFGRGFEVRR
ncbi:hypothetical protein DSECCO2_646970 [anaerobic digester metagenome]